MEVLGICLPYIKRCFQEHQWNAFSLGLRYLRFCCFRECRFWRDQRSQFKSYTVSKTFGMEVLGICLPYIKRYFHQHKWSAFFVRAQISQILLFLKMVVLKWSKITIWERHMFHYFFSYESFRYVSTSRKKIFSVTPVFFSAQLTHILLFSGMPPLERSKVTVWGQ